MTATQDDMCPDLSLRVEVAIDDPDLQEHVRGMLAARPGIAVVIVGERAADVRISDGALELADGVPLVVLSDGFDAQEVLAARAAAVLSTRVDADELAAALCAAAEGLIVLSPELRDSLLDRSPTTALESAEGDHLTVDLTSRELEVLRLLADGASNKAIARRLGITPHTAKFHVASITAKLGAHGRTDAVAKAMRLGLLMV